MELASVVFCFFEDLHRVHDVLNETRESYKVGTRDLVVASIITNLAFNVVRWAEEEIISLDPEMLSTSRLYEVWSLKIFR